MCAAARSGGEGLDGVDRTKQALRCVRREAIEGGHGERGEPSRPPRGGSLWRGRECDVARSQGRARGRPVGQADAGGRRGALRGSRMSQGAGERLGGGDQVVDRIDRGRRDGARRARGVLREVERAAAYRAMQITHAVNERAIGARAGQVS